MKLIVLHDDFGNRATIEELKILPFKGSKVKETGWKLTLSAEYENGFVYFVSVYPSRQDAMNKLKKYSCGTFK